MNCICQYWLQFIWSFIWIFFSWLVGIQIFKHFKLNHLFLITYFLSEKAYSSHDNLNDSLIHLFISLYEREHEVAQSCPTLHDPMDCRLPGSSFHGIFQARVLEWVAISFSREFSQSRDRTRVSHTAGRRFTIWATREAHFTVYKYPIQRRQWHPTPVLLPGESHGWRSLVGYSPWGR